MKKIFVSLGLAAAGTAGLHASILDLNTDTKDWTISGTLRGFYDDNYLTTSKKEGSTGFEINPSFSLHMPLQQTELGIRYTYGLYYYEKREEKHQNPIDQTHQFDLWIDHAFNPRWDLKFSDTASVTQDPSLTTGPVATAQRVSGNNLDNSANLNLHTIWTPEFSTAISYNNHFVRYDNRGAAVTNTVPPVVTPSYAGLLDRVEQTIGLEGDWEFTRKTTGSVGYQFGLVNFTAGEVTQFITNAPGHFAQSSDRDNYSHYGYVGLQHSFLENLQGSIQAGVQYTTYYNDPTAGNSLGPYGSANLIYTYAPGSYAQIGFSQSRNATDVVAQDKSGRITQDEESSVVFASINHPLTQKMVASLAGHYQFSVYNGGQNNNGSSKMYNLSANVTYNFNHHFSSETGYNFDYYTSPAGGTYTRNRVYLGFTASY